jgi:YidC/Oxa1 family membrane protein insertase
VTLPNIRRNWLAFGLLVAGALLLLAACATGPPGGSPGAPTPTPTPQHPLRPAQPTDPFNLLAWAFTPIFQALFIILVFVYDGLKEVGVPGAIGFAIIVLTIAVRAAVIPLVRRQLVSQRRMQMLQPEIREISRRHKGDALKSREAQQQLFRERGVNPFSGCLPLLLQLPLLFIVYAVIQNGITNYDPSAMLNVFGVQVVPLQCPAVPEIVNRVVKPCIDPIVPWLGNLDVSRPEILFTIPGIAFGISGLAIVSALLQLVQSRMLLAPVDPENDDPNARVQRQTMLFLPLISVLYGGILPAGLFIYWIVATIFQLVQQYLIVGWGGMFPFLGWHPAFARDHTPRFPVSVPPPDLTKRKPGAPALPDDRTVSAERTIRPAKRSRDRRGRRR